MNPIHQFEIQVSEALVDRNSHVNNVMYVQWMQDAAVRHSGASGCTKLTAELGAMWVVRSHQIEYLRQAFVGDTVVTQTWVYDFRKVRSLRCYQFTRAQDGQVLARGETDWVFIDARSGRPKAIPAEIQNLFQLLPAKAAPPAQSGGDLS